VAFTAGLAEAVKVFGSSIDLDDGADRGKEAEALSCVAPAAEAC
jgi:hypothetical protein